MVWDAKFFDNICHHRSHYPRQKQSFIMGRQHYLSYDKLRMLLAQLRHPLRLVNYLGPNLCYRLKLDRVPFQIPDQNPNCLFIHPARIERFTSFFKTNPAATILS